MGRRVKFYLTFIPISLLLLFSITSVGAYAEYDKKDNESLHNTVSDEAESILDEFLSILPEDVRGEVFDGEVMESVGVGQVLNEIGEALANNSLRTFSFFLMLIGCALIGSLLFVVEGRGQTVGWISALSASVILYTELRPLLFEVCEAIGALSEFFSGASGVITALLLASGEVNRAAVQGAGMNLTLSLFSAFGSSFLCTLAAAFFSVGIVSSVGGGRTYRSVAKGLRSLFFWGTGILSTLLVGLIALQGYIASSSDSVALRAAKYAASGMIPIVGGTVSGALSTLFSGLDYACGIVGGASVACILSIALSPLVLLISYRMTVGVSLFLCDFLPEGSCRDCFVGLASALDAIIAVYSLTAVIYILEILMFVRGGSAVF